jgi:AcrR family transcriptional regulator
MSRNKTLTRRKILDAVGQLLVRSGMRGLGINAISRQAGIDKTLIYRYFGNLDELLRAYADENTLWPNTPDSSTASSGPERLASASKIISEFLIGRLNELRRQKIVQEILRGELIEENILTQALSQLREEQKIELLARLHPDSRNVPGRDLEALLAFMNAAISYMVLHSKFRDKHLGIDLHSNFGWKRLEKLTRDLVDAYFSRAPSAADR